MECYQAAKELKAGTEQEKVVTDLRAAVWPMDMRRDDDSSSSTYWNPSTQELVMTRDGAKPVRISKETILSMSDAELAALRGRMGSGRVSSVRAIADLKKAARYDFGYIRPFRGHREQPQEPRRPVLVKEVELPARRRKGLARRVLRPLGKFVGYGVAIGLAYGISPAIGLMALGTWGMMSSLAGVYRGGRKPENRLDGDGGRGQLTLGGRGDGKPGN